MREIGEPTVIVHDLPGIQEETERNIENLQIVIERICSRVNGFETKVSIQYNDKIRNVELTDEQEHRPLI